MIFGVVVFPGSNCDHDMIYVLEHLFNQKVQKLWHKEKDLKGADFIILPGGFSYGDYLRSGAIARCSPIMDAVIRHAKNGGYVLGICNGFQILCEAHLLPGALLHNVHYKFSCNNIFLKPENTESIITQGLSMERVLKIPIAHGEGRFYADDSTLKEITENGQVLFRYCDEKGNILEQANPNGALENIAGISNKARNVFGMMPHPERACDPLLGNTDGRMIFESILSAVAKEAI